MEHLINYINDEYLYEYLETLISDPTTDETVLREVFETWNIPSHLIPLVLTTTKPIPAPTPAEIPKMQDLSALFQEERKPIRHSHVPSDIKRKILNSYDLRPITMAPCNPTLPDSPKTNNKNKIRYHNNQIVTNKGEKYVDFAKQNSNSKASS